MKVTIATLTRGTGNQGGLTVSSVDLVAENNQ